MANRTVLFLDVDGVLNPYKAQHAPRSWNRTWRKETSPGGTRIWVNRQLGETLATLDCDIVWATSWCRHPTDLDWLEQTLTVGPWERLDWAATEDAHSRNCMKRPAVERYLDGTDRAAVWVDDELGAEDLDFVTRRRQKAPIAAYAPHADRGLDDQTIEAIRNFINENSSTHLNG